MTMEQVLETIDLDVDENNELLFRVTIEGIDQSPAKVRLFCEGTDVSYVFNGKAAGQDGLIQFDVPPMIGKLKEGKYVANVEVLVENKYFTPIQFNLNFKKPVSVVAESLNVVARKPAPEVKVTATPVVVKKAQQTQHSTLRERSIARAASSELSEDQILQAAQNFVKQQRTLKK